MSSKRSKMPRFRLPPQIEPTPGAKAIPPVVALRLTGHRLGFIIRRYETTPMRGTSAATETAAGKQSERLAVSPCTNLPGDNGLTEQAALEQILVFAGIGENSRLLAGQLLHKFDSLSAVLALNKDELLAISGITENAVKLIRTVDWIGRHERQHVAVESAPGNASEVSSRLPSSESRLPPVIQSEMPLNIAGQSELPQVREPPASVKKAIQDALIAEGLLAMKLAHEAKSSDELQEILAKRLGQNSMEKGHRVVPVRVSGNGVGGCLTNGGLI